ncbi:MAG: mannose-6-phosphate isomerase, partial [Opitutaceae bacterium]|nr:mannose-6-phosphate isomerase [Opitutaceae bacterium]
MRKSNYEKFPAIKVPNSAGASATGWPDIADHLRRALEGRAAGRTVLVVECYPGVDETAVRDELSRRLTPALTVTASEALLPAEKVDALVAPFLGGNDPVFGFLADLTLPQFFDEGKLAVLQSR